MNVWLYSWFYLQYVVLNFEFKETGQLYLWRKRRQSVLEMDLRQIFDERCLRVTKAAFIKRQPAQRALQAPSLADVTSIFH